MLLSCVFLSALERLAQPGAASICAIADFSFCCKVLIADVYELLACALQFLIFVLQVAIVEFLVARGAFSQLLRVAAHAASAFFAPLAALTHAVSAVLQGAMADVYVVFAVFVHCASVSPVPPDVTAAPDGAPLPTAPDEALPPPPLPPPVPDRLELPESVSVFEPFPVVIPVPPRLIALFP